jgi:hypothetical protein
MRGGPGGQMAIPATVSTVYSGALGRAQSAAQNCGHDGRERQLRNPPCVERGVAKLERRDSGYPLRSNFAVRSYLTSALPAATPSRNHP